MPRPFFPPAPVGLALGAAALGLTALGPAARPADALAAAAPPYTITLTGVFSAVDSATFTGVAVGDAFTDTFTLPLDTPAETFSGPGRATFRSSLFTSGDTITFDGQTIAPSTLAGHYAQLDTALSSPPGSYTYPNIPPTADSLYGSSDGSGAGQAYVQVNWSLSTDPYPAAHALTGNGALPLSGPGLSDITAWQNMSFSIQSINLGAFGTASALAATPNAVPGQLRGTITGISAAPAATPAPAVPEAPAPALLTLALPALGLLAARRRASRP